MTDEERANATVRLLRGLGFVHVFPRGWNDDGIGSENILTCLRCGDTMTAQAFIDGPDTWEGPEEADQHFPNSAQVRCVK